MSVATENLTSQLLVEPETDWLAICVRACVRSFVHSSAFALYSTLGGSPLTTMLLSTPEGPPYPVMLYATAGLPLAVATTMTAVDGTMRPALPVTPMATYASLVICRAKSIWAVEPASDRPRRRTTALGWKLKLRVKPEARGTPHM